MDSHTPFHIAFPVSDLAASRYFYGTVLGCPEGRSSDTWIDFDLFGHQIVAHCKTKAPAEEGLHHNPVDGHNVPVPHFGVILDMPSWEALAERVKAAGVSFVIEPYIRFKGEVGEQATMFSSIPLETRLSSRHSPNTLKSSPSSSFLYIRVKDSSNVHRSHHGCRT